MISPWIGEVLPHVITKFGGSSETPVFLWLASWGAGNTESFWWIQTGVFMSVDVVKEEAHS